MRKETVEFLQYYDEDIELVEGYKPRYQDKEVVGMIVTEAQLRGALIEAILNVGEMDEPDTEEEWRNVRDAALDLRSLNQDQLGKRSIYY